jgi:hypothetical protein
MGAIDLNTGPDLPPKTDYRIGCIGAGFIMKDIHLVAYAEAGFDVVALASRTPANAQAVAAERGVETVYDTWEQLLDDERVEIVDIAFPPDQQLGIVREAVKRPHVKGILAQKPVAFTLDEAVEMVRLCDEAGVKLGVNHNMRYDQSMRALRSLLAAGELGEPKVRCDLLAAAVPGRSCAQPVRRPRRVDVEQEDDVAARPRSERTPQLLGAEPAGAQGRGPHGLEHALLQQLKAGTCVRAGGEPAGRQPLRPQGQRIACAVLTAREDQVDAAARVPGVVQDRAHAVAGPAGDPRPPRGPGGHTPVDHRAGDSLAHREPAQGVGQGGLAGAGQPGQLDDEGVGRRHRTWCPA